MRIKSCILASQRLGGGGKGKKNRKKRKNKTKPVDACSSDTNETEPKEVKLGYDIEELAAQKI